MWQGGETCNTDETSLRLKHVRNEGFMVCKREILAFKSYGLF